MTPKEKAIELIDKYDSTLTYLESKSKAKQCALIAVEEILSANLFNTDENEYWLQVKTEIENL
jgi:hypothetical protein